MIALPSRGATAQSVLGAMSAARARDAQWRAGKTWSLVYYAGAEVSELLQAAYTMFFAENGLNPLAFPSLKKFEAEVVAMTASLLGGDEESVGNMTTGGTESILMAVKTARDWARAQNPANAAPEMILPVTAHPAFEKAAHYFGVRTVRTRVTPDFRADVAAAKAALTPRTILLVGSAPAYPHGIVDPIAELAQIAREQNILLHVDACVGGFMLPFVRKLGYAVPDFDLSVPGVTSLSVDLHKYAYAAKGASLILYKNKDLRRHQFFTYADWPGGVYASPTMTGTRAGGAIAAAWAIMNYLGEEGYLRIADSVMQTTLKLRTGINAIDGLKILGDPTMSILAIGADTLNVYEVGDEMSLRGWHLDRQQFPPSLHLTVTHAHAQIVEQFLDDLRQSVKQAKRFGLEKLKNVLEVGLARAAAKILPPQWMSELTARVSPASGGKGAGLPTRAAAIYGMMASLPNRGDVNEIVLDLLDGMTRAEVR